MFKNYIKIAFRNILKQKAYSIINIFGLALGLAACILVGLFIWQDLNYDNYHENSEIISRISVQTITPAGLNHTAETPALVAPTLLQNFPEIDKLTRIFFSSKDLITYEDKKFYEEELIFADKDFFDMFTFKALQGNSATFLKDKNSVIISEKMADKYFGSEDPIGKTINYENKIDLEITGVIEDVPINSHFTFDMVATYETLEDLPVGAYLDQWGATFGSYTYIMLHPNSDQSMFEDKVSTFLSNAMEVTDGVTKSIILQPINSIHLYSNISDEINPNSSITYILILGSIALFILILACINFVNLTTARAVKRAREIGVRKVFGAFRYQLIRQFLSESILITLIALGFAFVIVELFERLFFQLIGTELIFSYFNNLSFFFIIVAASIFIGILSGLYPAFVLTHYNPTRVMKGTTKQGKSSAGVLRKALVLFQFTISIILIIVTILINLQINYMKNFEMGFEKDQIIILKTPTRMSRNSETIKNEINAIPGVIESSTSLGAPVLERGFGTSLMSDVSKEEEKFMISVKMIDHNYLDFYNINLLVGKRLSQTNSGTGI